MYFLKLVNILSSFFSAEWFWSQVNEPDLWICLCNIVYCHVCFSFSVKGSLQILPAQPGDVCLLELKTLKADQPQHLSLFNFFSILANFVIWKDFLNLFSRTVSGQCFQNKRSKCSHSFPPPLHSSKTIVASGSEYRGSFKLLFMTNLRAHFRWLMGTFPSLSIRTRALLS